VNEIEEDSGIPARNNSMLSDEISQQQSPDDMFVRSSPNLGGARTGARLLEEDLADPQERAPILRSAMKGGRRQFLADAEDRTTAIAHDHLRKQGKQRNPKAKELKKARKQMFDQVRGGKDALKQAGVPQGRRQFNRVAFKTESAMDFDPADAPSEIPAQMESDKRAWQQLRGAVANTNVLFEKHGLVRTEAEQQNEARKNDFQSAERSQAVYSRNVMNLASHLKTLVKQSPDDAHSNAYLADKNKAQIFQHTTGAAKKDFAQIEAQLGQPNLDPKRRDELLERASILESSATNQTDATVHAHAQGQTRAYSRNDRADVARFANNRGGAASRFLSGIGDFFAKIMPGAGRLFGASRDTRFEAAPGQREARDLLRQEQDTFRRNARSGKLGFMRMFFGRTSGSGHSRLPIGPRQDERPSTSEEYASEQRALAENSALDAPAAIQPSAAQQQVDFPAVDDRANDSFDDEEIKQPAEQSDDQLLEQSSMDGLLGHDE